MLTWSMIKLRRKHYLNILFIWEYRVGFVLFLRKNYKMFQNRKQEVSVEDMLWNNVFWCTLKFVVFPKILNSRYLYLYFWQPSKMIAQHIIIIFSQILRKKIFLLKTFSLVNRLTSYSHTLLLRSRPFHQYVALWPWPSYDLDIQHSSLTFCVNILFFSYNRFISWHIYFILTHNVALVETFTLICPIVTFKW